MSTNVEALLLGYIQSVITLLWKWVSNHHLRVLHHRNRDIQADLHLSKDTQEDLHLSRATLEDLHPSRDIQEDLHPNRDIQGQVHLHLSRGIHLKQHHPSKALQMLNQVSYGISLKLYRFFKFST